ncbi:MAG TPA: hypothetical protein VK419_14290 [Bryobacteraceae bacterium]|nr:hypothetical protein [Bryobacteraceae bacterium]
MKSNLASLRSEIEEYLRSHDVAIFHSAHHLDPRSSAAHWDTAGFPDFRSFLATAESAGVRLVALFAQEFREETIDDAAEMLEESDLARDDRRIIDQRLRELRAYAGLICEIELSFDLGSRAYIFDLRTDWYEEFSDILNQIEDVDEEEDEEPLGGPYFSKN